MGLRWTRDSAFSGNGALLAGSNVPTRRDPSALRSSGRGAPKDDKK